MYRVSSLLRSNKKEVRLRIQQHIMSFLCGKLGKIVLIIVLGAAFFGIANGVQAIQRASAKNASFSSSSVQSIIQDVFGADAPAAMNIAWCESSNNPNA